MHDGGTDGSRMKQSEIARALGLSKTTVSRAISGKGRVGEETREEIMRYIKSMEAEKNPDSAPTYNLGVALPADDYIKTSTYFSECLYGICEAAAHFKYNVLIVKAMEDNISEIVNVVEGKKVDAMILVRYMENDKAIQYLKSMKFPTGLAGRCEEDWVIQVDIDNEGAVEDIMTMMVNKGFKRFALIVEEITNLVNRKRQEGFLSALFKNGITENKQYIYRAKVSEEVLGMILQDIISNKTDCIVCGDDELGTKVLSWLQGEGYRVPADVAIFALYNSPVLNLMRPSVTAIDVSTRLVGLELGKQMCNYLQGKSYQKKTLMDYKILIKKSTGKI